MLLFGSVARGDAVPGSDIDLLLVLRETDVPFLERSGRYVAAAAGLSVEVLAYSAAELADMLAARNPLIRAALAEGQWLVRPHRAWLSAGGTAASAALEAGPE